MLRFVRLGLFLLAGASAFAAVDRRTTKAAPPASPPPAPVIEEGEIAGAKFTLARPAKWNHQLLLIAHGLRAESVPLVADLFPEQLAYKTLLDEGWMVAKTSFRRNGPIVADAISDLDALRAHVAETYGSPERVLLEGESMGGLIGTIVAERAPEIDEQGRPRYAGVIAIGAALSFKEPNTAIGLSLRPKIPLIFLTNQSELDGPKNYVATFVPRDSTDVRPVLLRVSRDGHVNVNQRERLAAVRALNTWLDSGPAALPQPSKEEPFLDVTAPPTPQPSQVAPTEDGRGFVTRVTEVSAIYGNIFLDAQPADFETAGIHPMTWFQLKVADKTYRVRYGRDFDSVKRSEWVAFPNADGFTWLARNFGDAAATAGLKLGDTVILRRYDNAAQSADPAP